MINSKGRLQVIVDFLNERELRATYGAVAKYIGVQPRSIGVMIGDHSARNSWVVSASSEHLPTGYDPVDYHPQLTRRSESLTITTAGTLARVMGNPW